MKRIDIYGVIEDAEPFIAAIDAATDDLEIHIDSPGGDVAEQQRMSIALQRFTMLHPDRAVGIVIEGLAASAAANFAATAPQSVAIRCYAQSAIMFHSVSGLVFGSPEQFRDQALYMEAYNRMIIAALQQRTSLDKGTLESWFQAGREGWLTGAYAADVGFAQLLEGDAPFKDFSQLTTAVYEPFRLIAMKGMNMAKKSQAETPEEIKDKILEEVVEQKTDDGKDKPEEFKEEIKEEVKEVVEEKTDDAGDKPEEVKDETIVEGDCDDPVRKLIERIDGIEAALADLASRLDGLTARAGVPKMTAKASPQPAASAVDFRKLVKEIPSGLTSAAYVARFEQLKKQHPAEYKAFMDANSRRFA